MTPPPLETLFWSAFPDLLVVVNPDGICLDFRLPSSWTLPSPSLGCPLDRVYGLTTTRIQRVIQGEQEGEVWVAAQGAYQWRCFPLSLDRVLILVRKITQSEEQDRIRHHHHLSLLSQIQTSVQQVELTHLSPHLSQLLPLLRDLADASHIQLWTVNRDGLNRWQLHLQGQDPDPGLSTPLSSPLPYQQMDPDGLLNRGQQVVVDTPDWIPAAYGAALCLPLMVNQCLWGVIAVDPFPLPLTGDRSPFEVLLQAIAALQREIERQEQAHQLQQKEHLLRQIIDGVPLGILLQDLSVGKTVLANTALLNMLGYADPEEVSLSGMTHPEDLPWGLSQLDLLQKGQQDRLELEKRLLRGTGEVVWARVTGRLLPDSHSSARYFIGLYEDITQRKQAELALFQSQTRLELAMSMTQMATWEWDLATQRQYWSPSNYRLLGFGTDGHGRVLDPDGVELSPYPTNELFMSRVHPEDREYLRQQEQQALEQNQGFECEYRWIWPDGSIRWRLVRGAYSWDPGKETATLLGIALDITDRKRVEEALRVSEARLEALVNNLPFRVWARNRGGEMVLQNPADQAAYGDKLGSRFQEADLNATMAPIWQDNWQRLRGGEVLTWESVEEIHGSIRHFLRITAPVEEGIGDIGLLGVAIDITERKRAEEALQRSQFQLSLAMKAARIIAWERDLVTNQESWSSEYQDLISLDRLESVDDHALSTPAQRQATFEEFLLHVHPDDRAKVIHSEQPLDNPHPFQSEYRILCSDGSIRWMLSQGSFVYNEQHQAVKLTGITLDITDRKREEQAAAHLATLVESSSDAIISTTLNGTILSWNNGAELTYGYTSQEAIGNRLTELILHPRTDSLDPPAAKTPVFSQSDEWVDPHEAQHRRKDGSLIEVFLTVSSIRNANGGISGFSWISRDISERRRLDKMKREFVSIVSHEMRTPLTSIQGSLTVLNTGKLGILSERGQKLLAIAEQNTARLVRLINDILNFERLESGQAQLRRERFSCAQLMQAAFDLMVGVADSEQITLMLDPVPLDLWGDQDQLLQVLTNLLSNAIKFSPPNSSVYLRAEVEPTRLVWQVEDQGRGIPAAMIETIFDPFQQVDASDSRQKGGTGLGLAICRNIVQNHGGQIWVHSRLGQGSTFFVALPLPCQTVKPIPQAG